MKYFRWFVVLTLFQMAAGWARADLPQVALEWTTSTAQDFAHYSVYRDEGDAWARLAEGLPVSTFTLVSTATAACFLDGGIDEQTTFTYFVTATDRAGNESRPSAVASVFTADRTPTAVVEGLVVRALGIDKETRSVRVRFDMDIGVMVVEED